MPQSQKNILQHICMKKLTYIPFLFFVFLSFKPNAQIYLDLKVFIEGPYYGTSMNTMLNSHNLIPLSQPYNVGPWNYIGNEQVTTIPNPEIVDWVLVELRETSGDASTATQDKMINRQAGFLKSDG